MGVRHGHAIYRDRRWPALRQAVTVAPTALGGHYLPGCGPYRFTATVGGGTVPEAVLTAFMRLSDYMAASPGQPGAHRELVTAGSVTVSKSRSASWAAQAIQNSGAGDLLRPYRMA